MKKGIKNLAIATMIGVASMGLMTGCKKDEDKPYIQLSGFDTTYIQNEDINLEGAKILYFSDKNDTTADEIKLTESMIANFNTETTGEKKMKVLWNGFELEIDYSVISTADIVSMYNTAYQNLLNAEHVHGSMTYSYENVSMEIFANVKDNKFYGKMQFGDEVEENWCEKVGDKWFRFLDEEDSETGEDLKRRYNINSKISSENVMEYAITNFISMDSRLEESDLEFYDEVLYDFDGAKTILTFKIGVDEGLTQIDEWIIENNKFIGCSMKEENSSGEVEYSISSSLSYNLEDVEMVNLPVGALEWELQD